MTLATHPRFAGYLPPVAASLTQPRLVSVKVEPAPAPMPAATLLDVLIADGERLHALPFIERRDGRTIVPQAYAPIEAVIAAIEPQLRTLDERFNVSREASLDLFSTDPDIVSWAPLQSPEALLVPGLAAYGLLFDLIDRYRFASIFCSGRHVVDLRPGCGFGGIVLGSRPASYAAVSTSEADARALARFCFASQEPAHAAEVVLAFATEPANLESTIARARERVKRDGRIVVSALGEPGREAFRALGLEPRPLTRPGLDPVPHPDFVAVLEPERVFSGAHVPSPASRVEVAARPLSVLFVLRPSAAVAFGGDVVQVRETANALRERGHRVEMTLDQVPQIPEGIDVVHLTNLTCPDETLPQAQAVASFEGPVVMMPIFIDHADEAIWGMQAAFDAVRYAATTEDLETHQRAVAERRMTIRRHDGAELLPPPARTDLGFNYTLNQMRILENVDFLIGNAYSEVYAIHRHLTTQIPFAIAPSCCNPSIYAPERASEFMERYNLRDFILSTGRIEARKQQLTLMQIARRWPERRLVLIGKNADVGFGAMLRICWSENVTLIPHMSEEELAGAYAAARVVAMPSWDEVVSLTSLNAAASGAALVLTRNGFEHEYMRDDAIYCDPGDIENIAAAIDRAWNLHEARSERRSALSERVRREYTWAQSAKATEEAYYRVLSDNPRGRTRASRQVAQTL